MKKATSTDVLDLLNKINAPTPEALAHREKWVAELKELASKPELSADEATRRFAEAALSSFFS